MEELHNNLLYIRDMMLVMDKMNQEELRLQHRMQPLIPEKKMCIKKKTKKVGWFILIGVIFIMLFLYYSLSYAKGSVRQSYELYKYELSEDEFAWKMTHEDDPYPGYQGTMKPESFQEAYIKRLPIALIISTIISVVIGAVIFAILRTLDESIDRRNIQQEEQYRMILKRNQDIRNKNQALQMQRNEIQKRKTFLSQEYCANVVEWFPRDYGYPSAVNYFINLLENHLVTTIPEAVREYQTYMFRKDVIENQKNMINALNVVINNQSIIISQQDELIRQQMIGNFLSFANLYEARKIVDNTGQIAHNTNQIESRYRK